MTSVKIEFKLGDHVIVGEKGRDYGKMCTIIEISDTNDELPVRIQVCNPHDPFDFGKFGPGVTERWISKKELWLVGIDLAR